MAYRVCIKEEENLVREKEQSMFYFTRKTRISHGLYDI